MDEHKGQDQGQDQYQQQYAYWLAAAFGIGNRTRKELLEYAGSPEQVYKLKEEELRKLIPESKVKKLIAARTSGEEVERQYLLLREKNINFFSIFHPDYPEKLKNIPDAPYGIFVEGCLPDAAVPAVAVIGARQCSEYGRYAANMCGRQLAEAGVNVISGLAKGIDGISQNAALEAGGKSYSVLGCGTNVCYPEENREIYVSVKKNGGVISEFPPNTQPRSGLFPMRNRIISGLADVVLIIEARNRSGTLITADLALEQGKEVYVIPGRVTDSLSVGCNRLLKQGAGILLSIDEMLEETGLAERLQTRVGMDKVTGNGPNSIKQNKGNAEHEAGVGGAGRRILKSLDYYPKNVETLQIETGLEYRKIVHEIMKLCINGKVCQVSAGQYIKI